MCHLSALGVLLAWAGLICATPAGAQTMVGLGYPPGAATPNSRALAVSADGSTVVGYSTLLNDQIYNTPYIEAFVRTAETGRMGLGPSFVGAATGVTADGSLVVGGGYNADGVHEAFIWTAETGMVGLGFLGGYESSNATGVSADGSTVVGYGYNYNANEYEAFIWTADSGMTGLGFLPDAPRRESIATGVSADGSTVVGTGIYADNYEAFVWTAASGMTGLGFPPGGYASQAYAISADGSTVVGDGNGFGGWGSFISTTTPGTMTMLPLAYARGVSADGSTVVGSKVNSDNNLEAVAWKSTTDTVTWLGYLPDAGYSWSLAFGVSADGAMIVGVSANVDSRDEAFVFNLHVAPTPAELIADLSETVEALVNGGVHLPANGRPLQAKLDAAAAALAANDLMSAKDNLNAFIKQVQAFVKTRKLTPAAGASLIDAAASIIAALRV